MVNLSGIFHCGKTLYLCCKALLLERPVYISVNSLGNWSPEMRYFPVSLIGGKTLIISLCVSSY